MQIELKQVFQAVGGEVRRWRFRNNAGAVFTVEGGPEMDDAAALLRAMAMEADAAYEGEEEPETKKEI